MAEKKSFVLYTDSRPQWEKLTDEQAGRVIKAAFTYSDIGEAPNFEAFPMEDLMFSVLKAQLDRDATKWEVSKKARSEAGKKGAEARWNKDE
ncbi:hypothetical protein HMPREF1141_0552 [Clostridium sp. MSTE9]|uniref:DUF6291 domain-containing protein n=1 Tax=Clostridium sp. (strain MSTE9) TaxID=1105031 RepID=UPI00026F2433|nr:DUF6291 domain-containing protein [Clostridium sp. MSTE9]EJF39183.1 hypothetical protein HMPREF1141_0552 [Clostridium sp. MSTE9]